MQFLASKPATLETLCESDTGRDWLAAHGLHLDLARFAKALRPPLVDDIARAHSSGGAPAPRLVFSGHQVSCDYHWSVVAKIESLLELAEPGLVPVLVWLDSDRSGSDRLTTSFGWPAQAGEPGINLVSNSQRRGETRFVAPRAELLESAASQLEAHAGNNARLGRLTAALRDFAHGTLRDLNLDLTHVLFESTGLADQPRYFVSELMQGGAARLGLARTLERSDAVVAVFNEAIEDLRYENIACPLTPRADDYLPLNWTCSRDLRRNVVRQEVRAGDRFAVARCKCGESIEVLIGPGRSGSVLEEALDTLCEQWMSPDVSAPLLFGSAFSGSVSGRSSALYGVVMNAVAERALELPVLPALVPPRIGDPPADFREVDSLLYAWLQGR